MANRFARTETRSAALTTEFGLDWATKLFGQETIDSLPVYKIGANKGKPKGFVLWSKTVNGGHIDHAWIGDRASTAANAAARGKWCGSEQALSLDRAYLFQEGRDRKIAEQNGCNQEYLDAASVVGQTAAETGTPLAPIIASYQALEEKIPGLVKAFEDGYGSHIRSFFGKSCPKCSTPHAASQAFSTQSEYSLACSRCGHNDVKLKAA